MPPDRLWGIDESNRGDHQYLAEGDRCFYFGEYLAHKSYKAGEINNLISNLKIEPEKIRKNPARRKYKEGAIDTIADSVRKVVLQPTAEKYTWVPIAPSKAVGHPDYDDRLERTLRKAFRGYAADIRLLLRQTESTEADHISGSRLSPKQLYDITTVDLDAAQSAAIRPGGIMLFDDLLTTGKHFKCSVQRLREAFGSIAVGGLFIARRILPNPFADFEPVQ